MCQCVTVTEGRGLTPAPALHSPVEVVREKGFHLDVEDYLAGVLIMASELVSLFLCLCISIFFKFCNVDSVPK